MKSLMFYFLCCITLNANAQLYSDSILIIREDSIGIKLAEVAIGNNPSIKILDNQVDGSKYNLKAVKGSWLNFVQGSFNVNELSLNSSNMPQNVFYPRYNLNIGVPLGLFFTKGNQVKQARSQVDEAGNRREVEKNSLRQEVRKSYQEYQLAKTMLTLQEMVLQDEQVLYTQMENKFKNGDASLEIFTNGTKRYNAEVVKRVTLANAVIAAKIDLEGLLGTSLETALSQIR